jgi:hypothetical protein
MALTVINIDTPTLGDRSYIAHDGKTALAVDPQRDIDRVQAILDREGLTLGGVVETHMHNDYVSGGLVLAQEHGAKTLKLRQLVTLQLKPFTPQVTRSLTCHMRFLITQKKRMASLLVVQCSTVQLVVLTCLAWIKLVNLRDYNMDRYID